MWAWWGYPSVGKSSIVARVSAARPAIAAYHFTTLSPVLGVVRLDAEHSFVLADLPGLIDGASKGVGLGHDFLRHIERTRVILHIVDVSGCEGRDPVEDFKKINEELVLYSEKLAKRPMLVVANKMDLPDAETNYQKLAAYVTSQGYPIMKASAATGQGLKEIMWKAYEMLQKAPPGGRNHRHRPCERSRSGFLHHHPGYGRCGFRGEGEEHRASGGHDQFRQR